MSLRESFARYGEVIDGIFLLTQSPFFFFFFQVKVIISY